MYCEIDKVRDLIGKLGKRLNNAEFYTPKVLKFFNGFLDEDVPLDAITYKDINTYLYEHLTSDRVNQYYGLKKFFEFTYIEKKTQDVMSKVNPPVLNAMKYQYISEEHVKKFKEFVFNEHEDIKERLLLGFFVFTGLTRGFIWSLKNRDIIESKDFLSVTISINNPEAVIPVTPKFAKVLIDYKSTLNITDLNKQIFDVTRGEAVNKILNELSVKIVGKKYPPTEYSYTFINRCLDMSDDIEAISKLVLKGASGIMKHKNSEAEVVYNRQKNIVGTLF
ncbi:MAG: hypothetical protein NAG76_08335 [Candidatus Pristimantibacillus lignocellulolyticus]|uniref:Uncharacterized protein n=1 Tax=Candidatus Pristimantibacillus lignocellulolyticus TaxID=2994561 RepID=A0A9J6ZJB9_9BACL|nr:MAG: hypothetical protein NAG76_08335 [Candidatus Pristimantibacillus lignocellulolyticus]